MEENKFPCIVIDCSFIAAFLLGGFCDDEDKSAKEAIEYVLKSNGQFYVPQLFWYEIGNVLLNASKKNKDGIARITPDQKLKIERCLASLPIYTDMQPDFEIRSAIGTYAKEYNLSYYDAAYLELARRYSLHLFTFDKELKSVFESL